MSNTFYECTIDQAAFTQAVQHIADLEYEYVLRMVGEDGLIRDIAQKDMGRKAVSLLERANIELFQDNESLGFRGEEHEEAYDSDLASMDYLSQVTGELGAIEGFHLIHINARRFIIDQFLRMGALHTETISIEAAYYPTGILVTKDRHDVFGRRDAEPEPLQVDPEDFAVVEEFVRNLTRFS